MTSSGHGASIVSSASRPASKRSHFDDALRPGIWPGLRCRSRHGRKPRGARAVDLMIAATALAHDLPLYTLNSKDLRGLESLIEIVDVSA